MNLHLSDKTFVRFYLFPFSVLFSTHTLYLRRRFRCRVWLWNNSHQLMCTLLIFSPDWFMTGITHSEWARLWIAFKKLQANWTMFRDHFVVIYTFSLSWAKAFYRQIPLSVVIAIVEKETKTHTMCLWFSVHGCLNRHKRTARRKKKTNKLKTDNSPIYRLTMFHYLMREVARQSKQTHCCNDYKAKLNCVCMTFKIRRRECHTIRDGIWSHDTFDMKRSETTLSVCSQMW